MSILVQALGVMVVVTVLAILMIAGGIAAAKLGDALDKREERTDEMYATLAVVSYGAGALGFLVTLLVLLTT